MAGERVTVAAQAEPGSRGVEQYSSALLSLHVGHSAPIIVRVCTGLPWRSRPTAVRSIGGDLKMDYTAVRRDCPRRLMSSSAGVADALEDLSGRGASGRVSFTRFPCMFRARTERRPQRAPQGFKPRYAVVQPESPSPHRRWAVPGAGGARVRALGARTVRRGVSKGRHSPSVSSAIGSLHDDPAAHVWVKRKKTRLRFSFDNRYHHI